VCGAVRKLATVECCRVLYRIVSYRIVSHRIVSYRVRCPMRCGAVRCSAVRCGAVRCGAVRLLLPAYWTCLTYARDARYPMVDSFVRSFVSRDGSGL
jgi:hypothetical protein